jgi:hypothetical protein
LTFPHPGLYRIYGNKNDDDDDDDQDYIHLAHICEQVVVEVTLFVNSIQI